MATTDKIGESQLTSVETQKLIVHLTAAFDIFLNRYIHLYLHKTSFFQ